MAQQEPPKTRIPSVMEDPGTKGIARVYAEAFVNATAKEDGEGALEEFESFQDDVLGSNAQFASLFLSGLLSRDEALALIDRAVAPHASPLFTSFLRTLAKHDRLPLLPLILKESRQVLESRTGRQRVQVISAKTLTPESLEQIRERVAQSVSFIPILEARTDPSLLGGLVIRIGDTVYDGSIKNRIKQLRKRLQQRSVNEIQSGRNRFSHTA